MRQLYGSAEQFLATFNPALQLLAARYPERAYRGTAPQLATVCSGYGEPVAVVWLCIQLENVNLFAGVKEKMPVDRQKELAGVILTEYAYLKVTELLLFFHRLKCGRYGRFYGSVDALFIASALLQFLDERRKDLVRYPASGAKKDGQPGASSVSSGASSEALPGGSPRVSGSLETACDPSSAPSPSGPMSYDEYRAWKAQKNRRVTESLAAPASSDEADPFNGLDPFECPALFDGADRPDCPSKGLLADTPHPIPHSHHP